MSLTRFLDYSGALDEDLANISNQGIAKIQTIIQQLVNQGVISSYDDEDVEEFLLTILTNSQSLLIRDATNNLNQLIPGTNSQFLSIVNNLLSWKNFSLSDISDFEITTPIVNDFLRYDGVSKWKNVQITTTNVAEGSSLYYSDTRVNSRLKGILIGNNEILTTGPTGTLTRLQQPLNDGMFITTISLPTKRLAWSTFSINTIPNLQTTLDAKIDESIVTESGDLIVGNANASVTRLALGTAGQVLTVNAGATSVEWADSVGSDKALTDLTDVTITAPNTGEILRKTNGDWTNQTLDTSIVPENGVNEYYSEAKVNGVLESKYTGKGRILVGAGNNIYTQIPAPTTTTMMLASDEINNPLSLSGLVWKEAPAALTYPLRSTIPGTQAAPAISFANSTGSGIYINGVNPTSLNFSFNGADVFWCFAQALQVRTTRGIFNKVGSILEPSYVFNTGNNDSGYSCVNNTNIHTSLSGISCHDISAIRTRIPTRLDIANTEIRDSSLRINNATNTFGIQNSTGSFEYMKFDVTNDHVIIPRNRSLCAHHSNLGQTWDTTIIANNVWELITAWPTSTSVIYGSMGAVNNGQIILAINANGDYKINVEVSCLVNDPANVYFRLSRNGVGNFVPGMATVTANNTVQSCSFSCVSSLSAGDVLRLATTSVFGALPKIVTLHTCSITLTNIFNS